MGKKVETLSGSVLNVCLFGFPYPPFKVRDNMCLRRCSLLLVILPKEGRVYIRVGVVAHGVWVHPLGWRLC